MPPAFDTDPTFADVLVVVRRHWRLVAAITLLITGLTAWAVYTAVPRYRAHAALRLQDERRMMTGGLETAALEGVMGRQTDPLLSEIQVLRSRAVLGEVVEREALRLGVLEGAFPRRSVTDISVTSEVPDTVHVTFHADRYEASTSRGSAAALYGQPVRVPGVEFTVATRPEDAEEALLLVTTHDMAIDNLSARLRTSQRERTDIFDVEFVSPDPLLAQQVVNTAAEVFRQRNLESAQQQSRRRLEFVTARLAETELTLAEAQRALSEFQTREQLFSSREKSAAQQVTLNTIEIRRDELVAERAMFGRLLASIDTEAGQNDAVRTIVSSPGIAQNPVISQLYTQLVRYRVVRDSMEVAGASATNPDFVAINTLIDGAESNLLEALESHIAALDGRISAAEEMIRRNAAELAAMPEAQAEEAVLLLEVQTIQRMADLLREEAQRARIAEAVEAGQVEIVDLAAFPSRPINDRKGLKLAIGLFVGLLLGGGGALLREQMNTSIRARDDVERYLNLTPLTVVPQFQMEARAPRFGLGRLARTARTNGTALTHAGPDNTRLVTLTDNHSPASEAFRKLRTALIFSQSTHKLHKLVVTSSAAAEGKSTTAANLAISFAQQGMRVLLVDGDLRRPSLHEIFGLASEPGLTELILDRTTPEEAVRPTNVPGLFVLPSGTQPPNPAEMIAGPRMRALVGQLETQFDLMIFDSPPVLAASEGPVLSVRSDGVVVVVRAGQTDRRSIQLAVHQLRSVGANIIGVVLNDADGKVPKYGYYDAYYYTYYGRDEVVEAGHAGA